MVNLGMSDQHCGSATLYSIELPLAMVLLILIYLLIYLFNYYLDSSVLLLSLSLPTGNTRLSYTVLYLDLITITITTTYCCVILFILL